jgi:hypothetical protein
MYLGPVGALRPVALTNWSPNTGLGREIFLLSGEVTKLARL